MGQIIKRLLFILLLLGPGLTSAKDLISAVVAGEKEQVEAILLDSTCNIDAIDCDGYSALHYAALSGNVALVDILCRAGANVNLPCYAPINPFKKTGASALSTALASDIDDDICFDIVKILLNAGASLIHLHASIPMQFVQSVEELSPLVVAIEHRNAKIVRYLLDISREREEKKYTNPIFKITSWKPGVPYTFEIAQKEHTHAQFLKRLSDQTPLLFLAIESRDPELFSLLLAQKECNVFERNGGKNLLHVAVDKQDVKLVELLLTVGKERASSDEVYSKWVNSVGGSPYRTPLHRAVVKNNVTMVKMLLEHGAKDSLQKQDAESKSPIDVANDDSMKAILLGKDSQCMFSWSQERSIFAGIGAVIVVQVLFYSFYCI